MGEADVAEAAERVVLQGACGAQPAEEAVDLAVVAVTGVQAVGLVPGEVGDDVVGPEGCRVERGPVGPEDLAEAPEGFAVGAEGLG